MHAIQALSVLLAAILTLSTSLSAQRRPAGSTLKETVVGTTIVLKVGAASYNFSGQAVCEHLPRGSIYDTPAERWSVSQDETGRSLSLTLWRPLSGGSDMVNLSLSMGGKRHDVNTVKSPQSKQTIGTGTVKFVSQDKGGTFTVDATAGSGASISGTIKCEAFTASRPVAG